MNNKTNKNKLFLKYILVFYPIFLIVLLGYLFFSEKDTIIKKSPSPFFEKTDRPDFFNPLTKIHDKKDASVTFQDVAGIHEILDDLKEITDFVKNGEKYAAMGASTPKGILLSGPPGTGKTLIAKAIAGETNLPFFSISGSDFVEMYVGVGASRVRKLFNDARKNGPSIVFIDEIDAIGSKRNSFQENSERLQTLNQLLTEMDGFTFSNSQVIVIAATNRIESLDPALLRSGRFDRRIYMPLPDLKARLDILFLHAKKVKLSCRASLEKIAKMTSGASGADLQNILNEAAILAVRKGEKEVSESSLEEARNRVLFGSQSATLELSQREKLTTAFHETGHTILSYLTENAVPAEKVTIIPRGNSLGHTEFSFDESKHNYWKNEITDQIAVLLGGRAAEEIFLGDVSSGAQSDLEKATFIAHDMVSKWGMNDRLGLASRSKFSEETAKAVDEEVRAILSSSYEKAKEILQKNDKQARLMTEMLLEFETLFSEDIQAIVNDTWDINEKRKKLNLPMAKA